MAPLYARTIVNRPRVPCINDDIKPAIRAKRRAEDKWWITNNVKGELRPEIFPLHMKVLTLIKAKSNVFL